MEIKNLEAITKTRNAILKASLVASLLFYSCSVQRIHYCIQPNIPKQNNEYLNKISLKGIKKPKYLYKSPRSTSRMYRKKTN